MVYYIPRVFDDDESLDSERRDAPRAGVSAQVRIHGAEDWAGVYKTGDLSASGAFLVSDSPPPRGLTVRIDLELDGSTTVQGVEALVVHVRAEASDPSARGCGLMFIRLDKDAAAALSSRVATLLEVV